jgi:class 3 adenylate cyclase/tetratricopeptide (TPR) repeat protein
VERKLATVLFVDLVDSTSLVTSADPEVVRRRLTRYFALASECIERHGGKVEKFAGDGVMAAFGVPQAHEDDAVRAVRAALEILESVGELQLEVRAGVESGEVVVEAADSTFVTGGAVNVAARLQQSAGPGTVVLGPGTYRLTRTKVEVGERSAVEVRGRGEVQSWQALRVVEGRRRPQAPFVGREAELALLRNSYDRMVRGRMSHLVTVFGDPGAGKSRLVAEFADGLERSTILTGGALPYGEGVAYWPLTAMIRASAGITDDDPAADAFEKLRLACGSDAVADPLAESLGVLGAAEAGDGKSAEIAWATLQWAKRLASAQPTVLVFDDIHWADELLLDLIEHLGRGLDESPALLVCVARKELLESRPSWGGGNPRAAALELGPLSSAESLELADAVLTPADATPEMRARTLELAEGNPLFVEETARMFLEGGGSDALDRIPDTLQTLIAARIDLLAGDAKRTLQAAAVIGRVFWRGALERLLDGLDAARLLGVLRDRELIVPEERSAISGDRAFRFRHGLICDVAYATVTKSERAELHRRFAVWAGERASDDAADTRAYHLDRACTLLAELDGCVDPALAAEAAAALQDAGERGLRGSAFATARRLLRRAVELEATIGRRYLAAAAAVELADLGAVATEMTIVRDQARAAGDRPLEGRALNALALVARGRDGDAIESERLAREALATLPDDDVDGRVDALFRLTSAAWWPGDVRRAESFVRQALDLAVERERRHLRTRALRTLLWLLEMRLELDEADEVLAAFAPAGDDVLEHARTRHAEASLLQLRGRLEEAAAGFDEARGVYLDAGLLGDAAWVGLLLGWIAFARDDVGGAERAFRDAGRVFAANDDRGRLCEAERALAEVMLEEGHIDEAERLALAARDHVGNHDLTSSVSTLRTLGLVRAAQQRDDEAEALLRQALASVEGTDCRLLELGAAAALARYLRARGRDSEAEQIEERLPRRIPGWLSREDSTAAPDDSALDERLAATTRRIAD